METSSSSSLAFITHLPETYQSNEPRIDETQLARRKRRRTSPSELSVLEEEFRTDSRPARQQRERIAARVGMTEKAVQIWFQNKRQQCRRQKSDPARRSSSVSNTSIGLSSAESSFDSSYLASSSNLQLATPATRSNTIPSPHATSPVSRNSSIFSLQAVEVSSPAPSPPPLHTSSSTPAPSRVSSQQLDAPVSLPLNDLVEQQRSRPSLAKRANTIRLAMSADGKAEVVVRAPLRPLNTNNMAPASLSRPATRFVSLPSPRELLERDAEAAQCLLFLKSGRGH